MSETANDLYTEWRVPPNLQRHLLTVAAVADAVLDAWFGPPIDRNRILRVLLLHDIGNVVKSDFDNQPNLLEEEQDRIDHWKHVQAEMIDRFGKDDHVASHRIAEIIGLSRDELALLDAKIFIKNDLTRESTDYELKLAAYADQRVAPHGVMGLLDRLSEAKERYRDKPGSSMNNPRTDLLIECAVAIENQLRQYMRINPDSITQDTLSDRIATLRHFRFE